MRVAAVDIGTNTIRLLIADREKQGLVDVERRLEVVGLGRGVDASGHLSDEAMARALTVLRDFGTIVHRESVTRVRAVATSATRDADNAPEFLDEATRALGVRPEVISGEAEAVLSFAGAVTGLPDDGTALVIDVGGGSTELVAGSVGVEWTRSIDLGSVRLTDRLLSDRPVSASDVAAARRHAAEHFAGLTVPAVDRVIGVAGTFTSLSGIHVALEEYDRAQVHATVLELQHMDALVDRLATLTVEETAAIPSLHPKRASVILGGAIVAAEALRVTGHDEVMVSEWDLLEGIALGL